MKTLVKAVAIATVVAATSASALFGNINNGWGGSNSDWGPFSGGNNFGPFDGGSNMGPFDGASNWGPF